MVRISPSDLKQIIAEAANYQAERCSFAPGYEMQGWQAEQALKAAHKSAKRLIATSMQLEATTTARQRKQSLKKTGSVKVTIKCTSVASPATGSSAK